MVVGRTGSPSVTLPQWYYDLADRTKASGIVAASQPRPVARMPLVKVSTAKPSSSSSGSAGNKSTKKHNEDNLKVRSAWETALGPVKSLPMNLIMSYFSGNSLQMVTISMTLYMFFLSPVRQIMGTNEVFSPFEGSKAIRNDIRVTKLVYILCSLVTLAAGIWKVGQMGLLPNHQSDWLAWEQVTVPVEHACLVSGLH